MTVHQRLACVLALGALVAGVAAQDAPAHFFGAVSDYTHSDGNCSSVVKDPLNVVFAGSTGTADNVSNFMDEVIGWHTNPTFFGFNITSPQWMMNHNQCQQQQYQQKNGTTRGHHCRLWQSADRDAKGRLETVCDAHEERVKAGENCGFIGSPFGATDAVYPTLDGYGSGFDAGVHELAVKITNDPTIDVHPIGYHQYPHKATFLQCSNEVVGWNGRQVFFGIDSIYGPAGGGP